MGSYKAGGGGVMTHPRDYDTPLTRDQILKMLIKWAEDASKDQWVQQTMAERFRLKVKGG